jgi:hypothetical protein
VSKLFRAIRGKIHNTTAMVLLDLLWPALLMAFTRYSRREPVGSFFRAISLFSRLVKIEIAALRSE